MPKKRKQTRHVPQEYLKIFDHGSNEYIGILGNLSTDGVMFVSRERIGSSSVLKCRIELPQPILDHHEIILEARQCWSRKNIAKGWWESGYKIDATDINKELISYLRIAFVVGKWKVPDAENVETTPAEDLRKTTRYEVKDRYPVYQRTSYQEIGKLADLSMVGASFLTRKPVKNGTVLQCKVQLPRPIFQRDYLYVDTECKWCKKDGDTGWYRSGYILQDVSEHDKVIILQLIMYDLEKQKTKQRVRVVNSKKPLQV